MPMDQYDDQRDDPFEGRLSAALHTTGSDFDTDRAALAARGTARGRRLRARRNVAVVGGAAAVALACVSGALLVANGGGGGDGRPNTSSVAASGKQTPTPTATTTATPSGVTAEQMMSTVKSLLPEGDVSQERSEGTEKPMMMPFASFVFDDGKGAAAMSVNLDRVEPGSEDARLFGTCPDKRLTDYDDCSVQRLPDGSVLRILQTYEYSDRREDTKVWYGDLITAKGQRVTLGEWNAPAEKGEPVSRPEPPLSPEQLKSFVTAKEWLALIDAIPEEDKPTAAPAEPPAGIGGQRIVVTLTGLLPQGVKVVDKGSQDSEYAYVVVDDGKGESFVQINVQPDMSDVRHQLFGAGSETLDDGTQVATRQGRGEKADLVMWTVDTMRPDGRRVVISAFNSGTQKDPATRETPALTMEQLRNIALSPRWEALG
ncbi:hypothetical protein [Streptomyces sp. NPDC018693]|uniref:hypothetical protein n=1 Tax=unclassified Streptomyces TaxID=2593676 RepID=UPI00379888D8